MTQGNRIEDKKLIEVVSKTEILKQQTLFKMGCVQIRNVHKYDNKYYLLIDEKALYEMTEIQFQKFWDMS